MIHNNLYICKKLSMKRLLFVYLALLTISCRNDHNVYPTELLQQPYQTPYKLTESQKYIYDIDAIPEITVEVPLAEWNKFLSYYDQNKDNEEYVQGKFTFKKNGNTEVLDNIGLRLKGNTSRRRPEGNTGQNHNPTNPDWHHASFTVSFKKFNKTQLFHGSEKVILKWFKDDAMYAREVFCYDLFEKFGVWTAPQTSYCRLTIKVNGGAAPAYFGVYQLIEPIDDTFLANRSSFWGTTGNLWKANWSSSFNDPSSSLMGIENVTLTSTYTPVYDYKSSKSNFNSARTQLQDFINNIKNKTGDDFKTYISQKMDVDLFLKTYAVNVAVGMWDDYWNNSNNFYFYFDPNGKFYFIPYDYDNTLGTSLLMPDAGIQDPLQWGKSQDNPLVAKIIAFPEYRATYVKYLNDLISPKYDLFYTKYSQQRIQTWQSKIASYITNDTGEDMEIRDVPAGWANCGFYRLRGNDISNNFFMRKASSIPRN